MKKIFRFGFRVVLSLLIILVGISIGMGGMAETTRSFPLGGVLMVLGLSMFGLGLFVLIRAGTELLDSFENTPAVDNAPAEPGAANKHQRNRLKFITALYALLLPAACVYALASTMIGDGHAAGCSLTPEYIMLIGFISYPLIIIGSVIAAWIFQNKNRPLPALLLTGLPILFPLIMFALLAMQPACR